MSRLKGSVQMTHASFELFLGNEAATCTTICFFPEIGRVIKRRSAEDFAWLFLALFGWGTLSWLVWGITNSQEPAVIGPSIVLPSVFIIALVKKVGHERTEFVAVSIGRRTAPFVASIARLVAPARGVAMRATRRSGKRGD
jgi:MtN3 and saliva related transmembrane protein